MRHSVIIFTAALLCMAALSSCHKVYNGDFNNVMIYYGGGYNNLAPEIKENINQLCTGDIPKGREHNAVLAFCHTVRNTGDYSTPNEPVLIRIYRDNKKGVVRDTLKSYPSSSVCMDEGMFGNVLADIRKDFPSAHYGLVFSSHSTGWIPPGYSSRDERNGSSTFSAPGRRESLPPGVYPELPHDPDYPETKSIGAQFYNSTSNSYQMELAAFARAIPMHLDYIVFDSCLMGCIEVAYELKDVCSYLVFSPTEILKQGMIYPPMAGHLLRSPAELKEVAEEYFNYYNTSSSTKAATVSFVDCSKLDKVASDMAGIIERHRNGLDNIQRNLVQRYFYNESTPKHWFYDIEDIALNIGADDSEMATLRHDLGEAVLYKASTPTFFDLKIERYSGISMYLPVSTWTSLNNYYRSLAWNDKVHLVK